MFGYRGRKRSGFLNPWNWVLLFLIVILWFLMVNIIAFFGDGADVCNLTVMAIFFSLFLWLLKGLHRRSILSYELVDRDLESARRRHRIQRSYVDPDGTHSAPSSGRHEMGHCHDCGGPRFMDGAECPHCGSPVTP